MTKEITKKETDTNILTDYVCIAEVLVCLNLFCQTDDLAKDWLIQSWSLENEQKKIAQIYYGLSCKNRAEFAERLATMTKKWTN